MTTDPSSPPRVHISCLIDDAPRFRMQAWNWMNALQALNTRCRVFVHHVPGALTPDLSAWLQARGATLIEVAAFGEGPARYCNKLRQLGSADFLDADFVILSDADLVFLEDPFHLVADGAFRAKHVDMDNPPRAMWEPLFHGAGLAQALVSVGTVALELMPSVSTFATNFNGGLYVMPAAMARQLAPRWEALARYSLGQSDLLSAYLHHSDQLGIGMALAEAGVLVQPLPAGANLPAHLPAELLQQLAPQPISAVHYHAHTDSHGLPRATGVVWIDEQIGRVCGRLAEARRHDFLNRVFWDFRYQHFAELGSGLGSRGDVLEQKRAMLRPYLAAIGAGGSILDVGCGDLEVFLPFGELNYTGLDMSEEALRIARAKMPHWTFRHGVIGDVADDSHDYCCCIDVLIHQPGEAAANQLVADLLRVARRGVILSIHTSPIAAVGISFCTAGLKDSISRLPMVTSVHAIGSYRDVSLYLVEKNHGERRTPHDIGLAERVIGDAITPDPQALQQLVDYSRSKVGFFPRTVIRCHEYPWFAAQMSDCAGQAILDVGAGVSLLPFLLADRGASVTTVDLHGTVRNQQPMAHWNEWGFLDYGALDPRIRSLQVDACQFDEGTRYATIYSVSVIEHMPAERRRVLLARLATLLEPGGRLLLSVDLIPQTDLLWNFSEGVLVDPVGHGTLDDLRQEIMGVGLAVSHEEALRHIPSSRTDVAYLVCSGASQ